MAHNRKKELRQERTDRTKKEYRRKIIDRQLQQQRIIVDGHFFYLPTGVTISAQQIAQALNSATQQPPPLHSAPNTTIWVANIPEGNSPLAFSPEFVPYDESAVPLQQTYASPSQQPGQWPALGGNIQSQPPNEQCDPIDHAAFAPPLAADAEFAAVTPQPLQAQAQTQTQAVHRQPYPLRFGDPRNIFGRPVASRFIHESNSYGGIVIYNGHINLPAQFLASQQLLNALNQQYLLTLQAYPQFNTPGHAWLILNNPQGQPIWTPFIISEEYGQALPANQHSPAAQHLQTASPDLPAQPNIQQFYQNAQQYQPAPQPQQSHDHFYISHYQGNQLINIYPVHMPPQQATAQTPPLHQPSSGGPAQAINLQATPAQPAGDNPGSAEQPTSTTPTSTGNIAADNLPRLIPHTDVVAEANPSEESTAPPEAPKNSEVETEEHKKDGGTSSDANQQSPPITATDPQRSEFIPGLSGASGSGSSTPGKRPQKRRR